MAAALLLGTTSSVSHETEDQVMTSPSSSFFLSYFSSSFVGLMVCYGYTTLLLAAR
jgi:hypothetical protein